MSCARLARIGGHTGGQAPRLDSTPTPPSGGATTGATRRRLTYVIPPLGYPKVGVIDVALGGSTAVINPGSPLGDDYGRRRNPGSPPAVVARYRGDRQTTRWVPCRIVWSSPQVDPPAVGIAAGTAGTHEGTHPAG